MRATDLLDVIYSAGVVFDGLHTSKPATDRFLRTGDTNGVRGRQDLALLEDLRDAAEFAAASAVGAAGTPVNAGYLAQINAHLTRSAALNPGRLRTQDQGIGVQTSYGRHEPPAITETELEELVAGVLQEFDPRRAAAELFVAIASAQPFEDGNKRTAIFAANAHLLAVGPEAETNRLLTVPQDDGDPSVARRFHDLLARAYVHGETEPVVEELLRWK